MAMSDTNPALHSGAGPTNRQSTHGGGLFSTEDWWAVWVGLLVIVVAWALFASGSSIKWLAVAPAKWSVTVSLTSRYPPRVQSPLGRLEKGPAQ